MDIKEYKIELLNRVRAGSEATASFTKDNFFEEISKILMDRGIYDDIEQHVYINTQKGINIDGYCWNDIEKVLSGIIVKYSDDVELVTISQSEIEKLGKQCSKFISNITNKKFLDSLAVTDPGRGLADTLLNYKEPAIKFRVIVITDHLLSDRVKLNKIKIDNIFDKETKIDIYDLEQIKSLDSNENDTAEPTDIDLCEYTGGNGLKALPANISEKGISSYLCIMPGSVLAELFDNHGQKLLEANVRTFLQFNNQVNRGLRKTLLKNPSDFFSYNNGLTVTASDIRVENVDGQLYITNIVDMQIVNGGQTTSAIYFSPREKGIQDGIDFRSIDLSKVFVQMKLTVINDKEKSEIIKENVARFANSQNKVQSSDLMSNHPLHRMIEKHSRSHQVPPGENNIRTYWFYERARGQYQTKLRVFRTATEKKKFEAINPKPQVFSKTDFAKYENTWRMLPHIVKKGAQKNLSEIAPFLIELYEKDSANFELPFYQDLISKMILFRKADKAIQHESNWYQAGGGGLKAETVTYTIALLRHLLLQDKKDINLKRIYDNQNISESLKTQLLDLGQLVRDKILDINFRDGTSNPSEFCKTEKAWNKFKNIKYPLMFLSDADFHSGEEIKNQKDTKKKLSKTSSKISAFEQVKDISSKEWVSILKFMQNRYPPGTKINTVLTKLATKKTNLELEDYDIAMDVYNNAIEQGYISTSE